MGKRDQGYQCSFCGKPKGDVRRLIAGPQGVFICDQCVQLCNQILASDAPAGGGHERGRGWRCRIQRLRSRWPGSHIATGT